MDQILTCTSSGSHTEILGQYKIYDIPIDAIFQKLQKFEEYVPNILVEKDKMQIKEKNGIRELNYDSMKANFTLSIRPETSSDKTKDIYINQLLNVLFMGSCKGIIVLNLVDKSENNQIMTEITLKSKLNFSGFMVGTLQKEVTKFFNNFVLNILKMLHQSKIEFYNDKTWAVWHAKTA